MVLGFRLQKLSIHEKVLTRLRYEGKIFAWEFFLLSEITIFDLKSPH